MSSSILSPGVCDERAGENASEPVLARCVRIGYTLGEIF